VPWTISDKNDLIDIIKFLEVYEWKNIQALSEYLSEGNYKQPLRGSVLTIIYRENRVITSLIVITAKGLLYPIIRMTSQEKISSKNELIRILASIKFNTHGIIGLKDDVDYLDSIIFKRIRGINNYILLHRDNNIKLIIDNTHNILKASPRDINRLLPLEIEYQKEEVLLNPKELNKKATMLNFKKKLQADDVYYIYENNIAISKCGTTYKSKKYTLIGGVFTWKSRRNLGYSTNLLKYMINEEEKKGLTSALFVKSSNSVALHLYKKLGFIDPVDYKINYYYN